MYKMLYIPDMFKDAIKKSKRVIFKEIGHVPMLKDSQK